jgi:hypothetical protein
MSDVVLPSPRERNSWALAVRSEGPIASLYQRGLLAGLREDGLPEPALVCEPAGSVLEAMGQRLVIVFLLRARSETDDAALRADLDRLRAGGSRVELFATRLGSVEGAEDRGRASRSLVATRLATLTSMVPTVDVEDLAARFASLTLHTAEWTHVAHLAVGLWHVHRFGAEEALARLRPGIRRLNETLGGANTETAGYHETITAAYVQVFEAFLAARSDAPIGRHVERFLSSALVDRGLLQRCYSKDHLMSTRARATWVEPDLAPLRLETLLGEASMAGEASHGG